MKLLEISGLSKRYGNESTALEDVSIVLERGSIMGLIGRNGAGKTTLMKICAQLLNDYQGSVLVDGKELQTLTSEQMKISYIPDEPVYFEFMTVGEHLDFIEGLYPEGFARKKDLVKKLELEPFLRKTPGQLSKGTKQKLMIALGLLRQFDLLIADEPFTGLDPEQVLVLRDLFLDAKSSSKGVIISTHLIDLVESYCDIYGVLKAGKMLAFGDKRQIAAEARLNPALSMREVYVSLVKGP